MCGVRVEGRRLVTTCRLVRSRGTRPAASAPAPAAGPPWLGASATLWPARGHLSAVGGRSAVVWDIGPPGAPPPVRRNGRATPLFGQRCPRAETKPSVRDCPRLGARRCSSATGPPSSGSASRPQSPPSRHHRRGGGGMPRPALLAGPTRRRRGHRPRRLPPPRGGVHAARRQTRRGARLGGMGARWVPLEGACGESLFAWRAG